MEHESQVSRSYPGTTRVTHHGEEGAQQSDDWKQQLVKKRIELVANIRLDARVWMMLLSGTNAVLSMQDKQRMELNHTPDETTTELLEFLPKRSNHHFETFCHALAVSRQKHVIDQYLSVSLPSAGRESVDESFEKITEKLEVPMYLRQVIGNPSNREKMATMKNLEVVTKLMESCPCLTTDKGAQPKLNSLLEHLTHSPVNAYFTLVMYLKLSRQNDLYDCLTDHLTREAVEHLTELRRKVYFQMLNDRYTDDRSELAKILKLQYRDYEELVINKEQSCLDESDQVGRTRSDKSKSRICLTELFETNGENKKPRTVFMIGAPGAGKSTAVMAIAKNWHKCHLSAPPFVIRLRSPKSSARTSLKNLLLINGPYCSDDETECARLWCALKKKEDEITVLIDGADEGPREFLNVNKTGNIDDETTEAPLPDVLWSLIQGSMLPQARVLLTTRPFNITQCWNLFNRKVDVVGFTEASLERFIENELGKDKAEAVWNYLKSRADLLSLCLIPLNAVALTEREKYNENEYDLLSSRTDFALSLLELLLELGDTKLKGLPSEGTIWDDKNSLLLKLSSLAVTLIAGSTYRVDITKRDLNEAEISEEERQECGLLTTRREPIYTARGPSLKTLYEVPHITLLEILAALGLSRPDQTKLLEAVRINDGRLDLLLIYVVGILGNKNHRKLLQYPDHNRAPSSIEGEGLEDIVRNILQSKRRLMDGGEQFCTRIINESKQWSCIPHLQKAIEGHDATPKSVEHVIAAHQVFTNQPPVTGSHSTPHPYRFTLSLDQLKHVNGEMHVDEYRQGITTEEVAILRKHTQIASFSLENFGRRIPVEVFADLCSSLSLSDSLLAVKLADCHIDQDSADGKSSSLVKLHDLRALGYIMLEKCHLKDVDVCAVLSHDSVIHIDLSDNEALTLQGMDLARLHRLRALSVEGCSLTAETIMRLCDALRGSNQLSFLNVFDNSVTAAACEAVLECPRLVELYASDGDVVLEALSTLEEVTSINHLWLQIFAYNETRAQQLKTVLCLHQPKWLTLHGCLMNTMLIEVLLQSISRPTSVCILPLCWTIDISEAIVAELCAHSFIHELWLCSSPCSQYLNVYQMKKILKEVSNNSHLHTLALYMRGFHLNDMRLALNSLTRSLTSLWLEVQPYQTEETAVLVSDVEQRLKCPGMTHITRNGDLNDVYFHLSGAFYQHGHASKPGTCCPQIPYGRMSPQRRYRDMYAKLKYKNNWESELIDNYMCQTSSPNVSAGSYKESQQ